MSRPSSKFVAYRGSASCEGWGVVATTGTGGDVGVGAGLGAIVGRSVGEIAGLRVAVAIVAEGDGDTAEGDGDTTVSGVRAGVETSVDPLHATARNADAAMRPTKRPFLTRNPDTRSIVAA